MLPRMLMLFAVAAPLAACGGFDVGQPAPAVSKTDPSLTAPPTELKNGTAVENARPR